jgi:hypothetical protein
VAILEEAFLEENILLNLVILDEGEIRPLDLPINLRQANDQASPG